MQCLSSIGLYFDCVLLVQLTAGLIEPQHTHHQINRLPDTVNSAFAPPLCATQRVSRTSPQLKRTHVARHPSRTFQIWTCQNRSVSPMPRKRKHNKSCNQIKQCKHNGKNDISVTVVQSARTQTSGRDESVISWHTPSGKCNITLSGLVQWGKDSQNNKTIVTINGQHTKAPVIHGNTGNLLDVSMCNFILMKKFKRQGQLFCNICHERLPA